MWGRYVSAKGYGAGEVDRAVNIGAVMDSGVEPPAVVDVAAHLFRRMQLFAALVLDQTSRWAWPISSRHPVFQLKHHGRRAFGPTPEKHHVTPGGRGRQPIFDTDVAPLAHVQVIPT